MRQVYRRFRRSAESPGALSCGRFVRRVQACVGEVIVEFKVALDVFSGPMDLLLYLVKKHEVDVTEVPIARIATEFVAYLDVLQDLEIGRAHV